MKKQIPPLLLSLALCLSLVTPALAAGKVAVSTDTNGDGTPDVCYTISEVLDTAVYQGVWRDTDNFDYEWVFGGNPERVTVYTVKTDAKIDISGVQSVSALDLELADGKLVIRDGEDDWNQVWTLKGEFVPIYPGEPDFTAAADGSYVQFIKEGFYAFTVQPNSPMGLKEEASCVLYVSKDGTPPSAPGIPAEPEQPAAPVKTFLDTDAYTLGANHDAVEVTHDRYGAPIYSVPVGTELAFIPKNNSMSLNVQPMQYAPGADHEWIGSSNPDGGYGRLLKAGTLDCDASAIFGPSEDVEVGYTYRYTLRYENTYYSCSAGGESAVVFHTVAAEKVIPPAVPTVAPVASPATLDGKAISLNAYLFTESSGGTNYVMLRDVASLLNGSKAQFEVTWDKDKGIILTTGQAYTPVGNELQGKGDGNKAYTVNKSTITINGKAVELTAYTIDGNNYFKLRDLGKALGFNVSWSKDKGVIIDSNAPYSDAN